MFSGVRTIVHRCWCLGLILAVVSGCRSSSSSSSEPPTTGERASRASAGCGREVVGSGEFERHAVSILGLERSYHVRLPKTYRASRPYPLIFRWHGSGGDGLSGGLGIERHAGEDAIVVAADGLHKVWVSVTRPSDLALFDAMLARVSDQYCVDLGKVFSYGFSLGAGFTAYLSCERAHALRGVAMVASRDTASEACRPPVAAWYLQDRDDDVIPFKDGKRALGKRLDANGCGPSTREDGPCARYTECRAGAPVVWCETAGRGHAIREDFAPAAVWAFFSSLR